MTGFMKNKEFDSSDVKITKRELLHSGFCKVERYTLQYRFFRGGWSPVQLREFVRKSSAVGIIPYDPWADKIVLIEQFRIGALEIEECPWQLEIVAGVHDNPQESYEELARREMIEETNLEPRMVFPICDYLVSPGFTTEKVRLFCASVDSTKAPQFSGLQKEGEDIKIHVVSTSEAFNAVRQGIINNGFAVIALQWLELNLASVRKQLL
jgi:ADP-ribose pyrophosphatase